MDFTLSMQMYCLLCSILCGLVLGVLYELFKVIRLYVFRGKVAVFLCDFIFMVTSAFVSVGFSIGFSRGNTRYFILLGEACGFLLVHFTVGRYLVKISGLIIVNLRKILKKTIDKIRKFGKRVLQLT